MRKFILGTDWWDDCDDVVAVRILARAHLAEKICVEGIAINACMEYSASSLEGFLNTESVRNISVGIDKTATYFKGNTSYQKMLAAYSNKIHSNNDAEDAVRMYRRILSESTEKLEIIEIGFLTVLSAVLESKPDDISPESGLELMSKKVSKIWVMGGIWTKKGEKENNFAKDKIVSRAAEHFLGKCPIPITFLGWETGYDVITGSKLKKEDILYKVISNHGFPNGRSSWDPMLVLMAIIGDEKKAGYDTVLGRARVEGETGENYFEESYDGMHTYVVRRLAKEEYERMIDEIIG